MTDPMLDEGRGRIPITHGVANAMVKFGAARQCPECGFGVPKYPGRYPKLCPRCGDELVLTDQAKEREGGKGRTKVKESVEVPVVCISRAVRIQKIIEGGRASFAPYLDDSACSRAVTIPYTALESHGGADGFRTFFEGPTRDGLYFRIEEREDPIIVAEFDNANAKVRMFATTNPRRYLATDPREDIVVEDHEGTFEAPLDENILKGIADNTISFLSQKLAKLWKTFGALRTVKAIWDEAQRTSGIKLPQSDATLRIAHGLNDEMREVFVALGDFGQYVGEKRAARKTPPLVESVTLTSVLGFALALIGGIPMLLGALSKATKWLGFSAVSRALGHAQHVAHAVEQGVISAAIPAELSYAVYTAMWKRGWRVGKVLGRSPKVERDAPLTFAEYLADPDYAKTIDSGMYRLLLLFFFVNGAMHILAAPLGVLFASEAAATSVKGVELSHGLKSALQFARTQGPRAAQMALEGVNPENVRMVDMGAAKLAETIDPAFATSMQLFVSESDARDAATRLGVALIPSKKTVGTESLWILTHESTGYALGKGEASRLEEYFGYDVARQRVVDADHHRVAGSFAEDKRSSARRPRKPGEGPTQLRGGFRIHVGKNQERKPRKDVEQALQNKQNQKRGLRARIEGAKKWHRSREGQQLHAALGNYNRSEGLRSKIADIIDRIASRTAGQTRSPVTPGTLVSEDMLPQSGGTSQTTARGPQDIESPVPDDHLEAILRRLIVTQNMDVLQDVEFDDVTGSIYLFFDPVLMPDEMQEVLAAIRQERGAIELVASPNMSLPGESVESDWWVLFLAGPGEGAAPDPEMYARRPEDYSTKVQAVVMAQPSPPEAVAQGIDVGKLMNAAGE